MRYFYCSNSDKVNKILQNGLISDDRGEISIIAVDEGFLMYKFVVDSYAYEILKIDEYCFFEILPEGITGNLSPLETENIFKPFFKTLHQLSIDKEYLIPQITERYKSMGLDIGVFLVENKQNFNNTYKKKILEYANGLV